jgi:hypothetical protein
MSVRKHIHWKTTSTVLGSIIVSGFFLLGLSFFPGDQPMPPAAAELRQSKMLEVGEELEYKVSYSFFNIGTIRMKVLGKEEHNGRTFYKTSALIDSNPGLDWLVTLHIRFYSEMDGTVYSYKWIEDDSTKKETHYKIFRFDYESKKAYLESGKVIPSGERKPESSDTIAVDANCQDGLSLFYYAREHVHQKNQESVPTLIEKKQERTLINFRNKRTDADADAVDYPVDVIEFDGKADYVGIFGLTGGFRGWFSNDEASVPILARMNVLLGSIKIQLVRWNRPGWQPPKYVESSQR